MEYKKTQHIMTAKKVWNLYLEGENKVDISKQLGITRMEVSHIIKYTTQALYKNYFTNKESIESTKDK